MQLCLHELVDRFKKSSILKGALKIHKSEKSPKFDEKMAELVQV